MNEDVQNIVREAVLKIINDTTSSKKIEKLIKTHREKIHFVPIQYRILGGVLQSLNIQFGNFIEKLIALVVDNDEKVSVMPLSNRREPLSMTAETDSLIDTYITNRQLPDSPDECDDVFNDLLRKIFEIETQSNLSKQTITKDIDALFQTQSGEIVYLEVKYNDDHDTGKFVDINRKFLKTYAGLINALKISDIELLKPIIYYFNPVKRYGPIYVPSSNIYRGSQLFDEYFETPFGDIDAYLRNLGDDAEIMALFDQLYQKIRYNT